MMPKYWAVPGQMLSKRMKGRTQDNNQNQALTDSNSVLEKRRKLDGATIEARDLAVSSGLHLHLRTATAIKYIDGDEDEKK